MKIGLLAFVAISVFGQESTTPSTAVVKTDYGDIVFHDVSVHRDKKPWFDARVENQTNTTWHVVSFDVSYSCGLARFEYVIVLPTISETGEAVSDRPAIAGDIPCLNPSGINLRFRSGNSDRAEEERRQIEADKRRATEKRLAEEAEARTQRRPALQKQLEKPHPTTPIEGYAIAPILIKDEACARDYLKALSLGGLDERKMLSDLFAYGCIQKLDHIYAAYGGKSVSAVSGSKKLLIRSVNLIRDVALEPLSNDAKDRESLTYQGFIAEGDFLWVSKQQMTDLVEGKTGR